MIFATFCFGRVLIVLVDVVVADMRTVSALPTTVRVLCVAMATSGAAVVVVAIVVDAVTTVLLEVADVSVIIEPVEVTLCGGLEKDCSSVSHVLPSVAGIAYAVAHTRVCVGALVRSMPPSDCCSVLRKSCGL